MTYGNRRTIFPEFLISALAVLILLSGCADKKAVNEIPAKKVIVLGFDGMDPLVVRDLMARGELPNLAKLAKNNENIVLGSSNPPQSPVAWSDFISGANPGVHGIFDFIQRDPKTYQPYFSMSEAVPPKRTWKIGDMVIPVGHSGMRLLRKGEAFWNVLERSGIEATVFRVPSNFPPQQSGAKTFSGMGTPDLRGGYGSFSFFTDDRSYDTSALTGGTVNFVDVSKGRFSSAIEGPDDTFVKGSPIAKAAFSVKVDRENRTALIEIDKKKILLEQGEWSGWTPVEFRLAKGFVKSHGIVLFYLKEAAPHFRLYVSPVNIDPSRPDVPVSTPPAFSKELARRYGYFYTAGMPEDTKALDHGILSDAEYLQQTAIHHKEQKRIFRGMLKKHKHGLLFFYFSNTDLGQHMFWSAMDKNHPMHGKRDPKYAGVISALYRELDGLAGEAMKTLGPKDTIIIISDHGFSPYYYAFHLNTWLLDNGFVRLLDGTDRKNDEFLMSVDWQGTKAYALGFNSLYINLSGREANGIVDAYSEKKKLMNEIRRRLLATVDPATGLHPVSSVYFAEDIYKGPQLKNAPDMIIGYNRKYRGSWETALGKFPLKQIEPNREKWSGDHCMDSKLVPGVIFSNRRIMTGAPKLRDVPAGIIDEFGIPVPAGMQGRPLFKKEKQR